MADEIFIVEACIPKPGDTLVICTKESLSQEVIYQMRGQIERYFENMGVKVIIVAADKTYLLTPEENHDYNPN